MKKKEEIFYCTKCGEKLVWKQDYAEKYIYNSYPEERFDKYNNRTGKQQIVGWWECPKGRWWNFHDCTIKKLVSSQNTQGKER